MEKSMKFENMKINTNGNFESAVLILGNNGIAYKSISESKGISKEEVKDVGIHRSVQEYALRIFADSIHELIGLKECDVPRVKDFFFKNYKIDVHLENLEISDVISGNLLMTKYSLEYQSCFRIFDIPVGNIKEISEYKNDLTVVLQEFEDDAVSEIKFSTSNRDLASSLNRDKHVDDIIVLSELQCVNPRGKIDFTFTPSHFRMAGSTYEHKISYERISHIYKCERGDTIYILIAVEPGIKQGNTIYDNIALKFDRNIIERFDVLEEFSEYRLHSVYTEELYATFMDVIAKLANHPITESSSFATIGGCKYIRAVNKAIDGAVFFLEDVAIFLPKPIVVAYRDIKVVEFGRINLSSQVTKTIDMRMVTSDRPISFTGIPKVDFGQIEQFLGEKMIVIRSEVVDEDSEEDMLEESDYESDSIIDEEEYVN